LQFINKLLEKNSNLVLDKLTIADLVAASHISILDYLGEIDWRSHPKIKDWYLIIKSRPSFRQILKDYIIGIVPSKNYYDLDF
jgi:glutathione S-transferase